MKLIDSVARSTKVLLRASSSIHFNDDKAEEKVGWEETAPKNDAFDKQVATSVAARAQRVAERLQQYMATHKKNTKGSSKAIALFRHEEIELEKKLGRGAFSDIYAVASFQNKSASSDAKKNAISDETIKKVDPSRYCVKVLRSDLDNEKALQLAAQDLMTESLIMSTLNHDNVLSLAGWSSVGVKGYQSCRHDGFFLVLERITTTLGEKLPEWELRHFRARSILRGGKDKWKALQEERLMVASQLAQGVAYLHRRDIVHRDIKPDNVGLDANGKVKLLDFGIARTLPLRNNKDDDDETFLLTPCSGSLYYMAPEVWFKERYNAKVDVYSFSVLLYQILTARTPFGKRLNREDLCDRVFTKKFRPIIPKHCCSANLRDIMSQGWSPDSTKRPNMDFVEKQITAEVPAPKERSGNILVSKPFFENNIGFGSCVHPSTHASGRHCTTTRRGGTNHLTDSASSCVYATNHG